MRNRKLRNWMIEQHRIETGVSLPYRYKLSGKKDFLALKVGTNYSYMIQHKRMWMNTVVNKRSRRTDAFFLHYKINFRSGSL